MRLHPIGTCAGLYGTESQIFAAGNQSVGEIANSYRAKATSEYKAGIKLAGLLGYELGGGLRVEGELFFARAGVDKLRYSDVSTLGVPIPGEVPLEVSGSANQFGAMGNVRFDFPTGSDWVPFVGGGLGFTRVDQSDVSYDRNTTVRESFVRALQVPAVRQALAANQGENTLAGLNLEDPQALARILSSIDAPEVSTTDT